MVLHNYMNYVDLKDYIYLIYEVSVDGEVDCVGQIELDESIPAHEEKTIKLPVSIPDSGKCYLKVSYCLKNNTPIHEKTNSINIINIFIKFIFPSNRISSVYLCISSKSWPNFMTSCLMFII